MQVTCPAPSCGKAITVSDPGPGVRHRCPHCGQEFDTPALLNLPPAATRSLPPEKAAPAPTLCPEASPPAAAPALPAVTRSLPPEPPAVTRDLKEAVAYAAVDGASNAMVAEPPMARLHTPAKRPNRFDR